MKKTASFYCLIILSLSIIPVGAQQPESVKGNLLPAGAASGGFTKCIIDERPKLADVCIPQPGKVKADDFDPKTVNASDSNAEIAKWYSGQWYAQTPGKEKYFQTEDGTLAMRQGGDLTSCHPKIMKNGAGALPSLPGKDGFYIEFEISLSDNDPDHFPAVWLMPIEKNQRQEDVFAGDPEKFERWMELDVDEGGFGPGWTCTVHNCWGRYPNYQQLQNPGNVSKTPLDRTRRHRFGASYAPKSQTVCWWLDDQLILVQSAPYVPEVAANLNYYLIMGAQMHKQKKEYYMYVHAVRAYTTQSSDRAAVK